MSGLEAAAAWCALQVTIVAAAALGVAWLAARRAASAAATAAAAAAITIVALTAVAPLPLPALMSSSGFGQPARNSSALPPAEATSAAVGSADSPPGLAATLDEIVAALRLLRASANVHAGKPAAARWTLTATVGIAALGIARLAVALRHVQRLRRHSRAVSCPRAQRHFEELVGALELHRPVALRESWELASPAVAGWRRPVVLLPETHSRWSDHHLRAALAHELAHAARGDFAWRLAASAAQALHYWHPLVHCLMQRLVLSQEMAADELAAAAIGGRGRYLRSLSELAMRQDDQGGLRAELTMLPAFSSHLLRRIAMLRSKEGSSGGTGRAAWGAVAAAAIAVVGVGTMAVRGAAESPAANVTQKSDGSPVATAAAEPPAFGRTPIDLSMLPRIHQGACVVRLQELAQHPAFAPVIAFANRQAERMFPFGREGAAPSIHFEAIEYVACEFDAKFKVKTEKAEGDNREFSVSVENFVIRFSERVDWRAWIKANVGGAEERRDGEFEYVLLPAIPAAGSARMGVAARDGRTLVFAVNPELLRAMAEGRGGKVDPAADELWQSLDGGLVCATIPDAELADIAVNATGAAGTNDPSVEWLRNLCSLVRRLGGGFDLDAVSNQSTVQVTFGCVDRQSAEQLKGMMEMWGPAAVAYFELTAANPPRAVYEDGKTPTQTVGDADTERLGAEWYLELIKNCTVEIIEGGAGRVDVRLRSLAPFPPSIMTAYEVAEGGDAKETARR